MREVEFRRRFDENNAARVRFGLDRNRIVEFVVQLEGLFGHEWKPIVRYDTAHGYAHRDLMHPGAETEKSRLSLADYNSALTYAIDDLAKNWSSYRTRFETWLQETHPRED